MARRKKDVQSSVPEPGKDQAERWQSVIAETWAWRRRIAQDRRWDDFLKEYKNDWDHITKKVKIPVLPLNLVFAYVKTEVAKLYFQDPFISVNPKRPNDIVSAKVAELLLNYYWGELNLKREIKKALIDSLIIGHGWMKIGYTAEFMPIEFDVTDKKEVELNEFIKNDSVFAYRVSWQDILFSPDSVNPPYDSRWIAHRIVRPFSSLMNSKLYKNLEGLKPSVHPMTKDNDELKTFADTVTLWEIWDRDHKKVYTIAEGHNKFLRETDWLYQNLEGYPFIMFGFNEIPDEPYPLSDVAVQEPVIVDMMKMMSIMVNHLKRWNRQIFVKEGFMTDEEMAKYKQGVDGAIIQYRGNQADYFIPPYAPVQQDVYGVWNLLQDMWQNIVGQSAPERGGQARTQTRTLGELRLTLTGGRARSDEKLDALEDSIEEVARKMLQIMKETLTIPKFVRIIGSRQEEILDLIRQRVTANQEDALTGEQAFTANKEDIQGEFDVKVVAGSTVPLSKENRLQILSDIIRFLPALGILPGSKASRDLGKEIFRDMGVLSVEQIFKQADLEAQNQELLQQQLQALQGFGQGFPSATPTGGQALQDEITAQQQSGL